MSYYSNNRCCFRTVVLKHASAQALKKSQYFRHIVLVVFSHQKEKEYNFKQLSIICLVRLI